MVYRGRLTQGLVSLRAFVSQHCVIIWGKSAGKFARRDEILSEIFLLAKDEDGYGIELDNYQIYVIIISMIELMIESKLRSW